MVVASLGITFNSSPGLFPQPSLPLSVNHKSCVSGCQSKPTVLRIPRACTWKSPPVVLNEFRVEYGRGRSQMLQGAPCGT